MKEDLRNQNAVSAPCEQNRISNWSKCPPMEMAVASFDAHFKLARAVISGLKRPVPHTHFHTCPHLMEGTDGQL